MGKFRETTNLTIVHMLTMIWRNFHKLNIKHFVCLVNLELSKTVILTTLEALNFKFGKFAQIFNAEIYLYQNPELLNMWKWLLLISCKINVANKLSNFYTLALKKLAAVLAFGQPLLAFGIYPIECTDIWLTSVF